MGFFAGAAAGAAGTVGVQKLLSRNKLELTTCEPEVAKWFTSGGNGVVVEETKDDQYLFTLVEDDKGDVEHRKFRSWDVGMRWAVGALRKRGLVSGEQRASNPKVQTVEELRKLRGEGAVLYFVEYLPYLEARDPDTGESFGEEHGYGEDIYTERTEAIRRYDVLKRSPDTVETLALSVTGGHKRGHPRGGRRELDSWEDKPKAVVVKRAPNPGVSASDLTGRLKF